MWFKRDFYDNLKHSQPQPPVNVKILKGPRQVGKTSLLEQIPSYQLILFDDHVVRGRAQESPSLFLDQFKNSLILDEATPVPEIFLEIKKRVDNIKRKIRKNEPHEFIDYWITGSNQTLMSKYVQESLAGRAEYYNLNTLSLHEIGKLDLSSFLFRGGWPELNVDETLNPVQYLNNLVSTFIEKDIVQAAGIEKISPFTKSLQLLAGQIGELINFSAIASAVGVDSTTVQSWTHVLEQNSLIKQIKPYINNINKRLIKTSKVYFEDVSLATRMQGWTEFQPLFVSPYFGHMIENVAYSEFSRFFTNNIMEQKIYFIRTKEKVEIDFLIELPNKKFISAEVKTTPRDYSTEQIKLLDSLKLNLVEKWIVTPEGSGSYGQTKIIPFLDIYENLRRVIG